MAGREESVQSAASKPLASTRGVPALFVAEHGSQAPATCRWPLAASVGSRACCTEVCRWHATACTYHRCLRDDRARGYVCPYASSLAARVARHMVYCHDARRPRTGVPVNARRRPHAPARTQALACWQCSAHACWGLSSTAHVCHTRARASFFRRTSHMGGLVHTHKHMSLIGLHVVCAKPR